MKYYIFDFSSFWVCDFWTCRLSQFSSFRPLDLSTFQLSTARLLQFSIWRLSHFLTFLTVWRFDFTTFWLSHFLNFQNFEFLTFRLSDFSHFRLFDFWMRPFLSAAVGRHPKALRIDHPNGVVHHTNNDVDFTDSQMSTVLIRSTNFQYDKGTYRIVNPEVTKIDQVELKQTHVCLDRKHTTNRGKCRYHVSVGTNLETMLPI